VKEQGVQKTIAREEAVSEALRSLGPAVDAHTLLIRIYRNEQLEPHVRLAAARAAIPYEKPRASDSQAPMVDVTPQDAHDPLDPAIDAWNAAAERGPTGTA
jgi:hypothetical protein